MARTVSIPYPLGLYIRPTYDMLADKKKCPLRCRNGEIWHYSGATDQWVEDCPHCTQPTQEEER